MFGSVWDQRWTENDWGMNEEYECYNCGNWDCVCDGTDPGMETTNECSEGHRLVGRYCHQCYDEPEDLEDNWKHRPL